MPFGRILQGEPLDVVAERHTAGSSAETPSRARLVQRQKFIQQQRHGPAIEENVMMAEDEDMLVLRSAEEGETQQRRAVKFELPRSICPQNVLDAAPLFLGRKFAQINEVPLGSSIAIHGLQMLPVLQDDGAAQNSVSRNKRVPSCETHVCRAA